MENTQEKAGLKFHLFDIFKVTFERGTGEKDYQMKVGINHTVKKNSIDNSKFLTYFHIVLSSLDEAKPLNIQIEAVGHFSLVGKLSDEIIDNYLNLSAPSIVYPYIRAFVSNFTLQTGINAIILPPINFADSPQSQQNEENI